MTGLEAEHKTMVDVLKAADAELKIVIAGNHDLTLDKEYYTQFGHLSHPANLQDLDKIRDLYCGEEARRHGIVYMEEQFKTFDLKNGARFTVYASQYQPEFYNWAFMYPRTQDRFNPSVPVAAFQAPRPVPSFPGVDIMLTHGPPHGILDKVEYGNHRVGCEHLRRAVARARPRIHCFRHIDEGYGAERMHWESESKKSIQQDANAVFQNRSAYINASSDGGGTLTFGEETLFINASIMDVQYNPRNSPGLWILICLVHMR